MAQGRTVAIVFLFLIGFPAVGCGYLDDDLLVSDEQFEAGFGTGGIGMSGRGYSTSCGGAHVRLGRLRLGEGATARMSSSTLVRSPSQMTDQEILEQTEIGIVYERDRSSERAEPSAIEKAYHETREKRVRAASYDDLIIY